MHPIDRRSFLRLLGAAGAGAFLSSNQRVFGAEATATARVASPLVRFPEKTELILLTDRPPQLETPIRYFREDFTPNEAFFVRWHLSGIPTRVDTRAFRLSIAGHVNTPVSLSLDELRRNFEPVTLAAVAQCSGNSRSFFEPRVAGGQWGNGAVGNAKWTGVRLRDLLSRAGVRAGAVEVSFGGLDQPAYPGPERFVKALSLDHASDGEVMVAYAVNDRDLPMLNGFPLRLIVPGWFATYWVKSLNEITVLPEKFKGFWMDKAYRIPKNDTASESPQQLATETVPINRHDVRSLFVIPEAGQSVRAGEALEVQGIAFDDGSGIRRVELSADGGKSWAEAKLDAELGKYAWRRWRFSWKPDARGDHQLQCRAANAAGQTQPERKIWNRSGYMQNVIERVDVRVV
jgi:sulfite dehydrogenase